MIFTQIRTPLILKDCELPSLGDNDSDIQIEEAEWCLDYEAPYIPVSLHLKFGRNGNRSHCENPYFEKRKELSALVLGAYPGRKGCFLNRTIDTLYSILQETTRTFVARNTFDRDDARGRNHDNETRECLWRRQNHGIRKESRFLGKRACRDRDDCL